MIAFHYMAQQGKKETQPSLIFNYSRYAISLKHTQIYNKFSYLTTYFTPSACIKSAFGITKSQQI